ncbi:heparin lyase I family protein [Actinomycetospora soli]|uniref:heparin lyase I family protein n=1 Tax=Actinomycetospora soli TaxID=2893887 RepID=UPI001E29C429|nr:heparin lyase I family protein [Actinomycetospora soli]MCD2190982.1 polysaccharide lyase [Actinomycetospora soli]
MATHRRETVEQPEPPATTPRPGSGRRPWWVAVAVMLLAAAMLALWAGTQAHGQGWWPATGLPPGQHATVAPAALNSLTGNPWAPREGDGTATFDSRRDGFAATADQEQAEDAPKPRYRTVDGVEVAEFSLPGGGKRAEIVPDTPSDRDGEERWVRYRTQLRDMPVDTESWQLILQWHHNGNSGSPPIALEVGRGELRLANEGAHQQSLGPIGSNDVVDVVLHVRFSQDPAEGLVEVWRDGRPVLAGYHPPGGTLLDSSNYLKFGLYRDPDITQPTSMTVTDLVIGDTPAAVGATP